MLAKTNNDPLRKLFAGLTEHAFMAEIGMANTRLVDYLSRLLVRFCHRDAIYSVKGPGGQRLQELAEMAFEAEQTSLDRDARREIFRHMGDFALFWTGVYPEAIMIRSRFPHKDSMLDYVEQGKRSYFLASKYADTPTYAEEAPVLRQLSAEFELCAHGLRRVRSHWERAQASQAASED